MYKRLSAVMFPLCALLLAGAVFWGYQEHQEKNAVLIKAENQYQRAFHDLTNHMSSLQEQLGKTLAVNSASYRMQRKGLVNVWRLTSQAQNEVNQLPLALLPFNQAESFLSRISDFAYRTSVRDLTKEPLSEKETRTMQSLYAKAADINKELGKVQDAVLSDHLRWMDVEVAMASADQTADNSIIDGFKTVDKKVSAYPENDWGPSSASQHVQRARANVSGPRITAEEARRNALDFLGLSAQAAGREIHVTENGAKTDHPTYTATVTTGKGASKTEGQRIVMDFTAKGGKLLWYMNPRLVKTRSLSVGAAKQKAIEFLKNKGYPSMTPVTYDEYDHVAVFTFVAEQNGVLIYPDKVTVRIALDNGEAVGLQAADHVYHEASIGVGKATVDEAKAKSALHPKLQVSGHRLAVIENDEDKEVLCHEYTGKINGSQYRIYVNAGTGIEEKVEQIPDSARAIL
ncbi:germination protein YpeB [Cohnella sp. GbtcB17]|uniref:germination protein YpeB n=1 Tax=Cohnella sp. GbtcB17 TaxID=2824762 RepID=UPI001C307FEB|nr:germination protein YpeB [Cohnella sp. GbtcB17]